MPHDALGTLARMPLLLPAVRSARDALATSLLLLVPWSMFAAAALGAVGAWPVAVWLLAPSAAAAAVALALATVCAMADRPQPEDPEDEDGPGGEPRDPAPPRPPRGGLGLDWDAFDEARAAWAQRHSGTSQRTPSGGRVSVAETGWPCQLSGSVSTAP